MSCGWVAEERERGKRTNERGWGCKGGHKERGRITKRNEDRERRRENGGKVGRKDGERKMMIG